MIICEDTKIADIIKVNPKSIEVIASINKHFHKLKNPILRKLLASRVTIRDAANIGNVKPEEILMELQKIGFEFQSKEKKSVSGSDLATEKDGIMHPTEGNHELLRENVIQLDVRPILDAGTDPFNMIMKQIKQLEPGQQLLVINTFEPVPLINMLQEQGFTYETSRPQPGVVHTLLYRKEQTVNLNSSKPNIYENDVALFDEKLQAFKNSCRVVDVRDLEMPLPMVTILKELELLSEGQVLLVEHKKFPGFLLEELSARGFSLVSNKLSDRHTRLLIFR